ncbi:MAG TPA: hypothetical protein VFX97_08600 [Pyrinomonadaceae bacterium]|nr:hypothetical protein [Pyrinomonadaceae bacterium]
MKQVVPFAIRMFLTALVAWVSGLVLVSAVLYSSNGGADFSFTDIAGFGGIIIIGSAILLLIYYLPAMFWLRRKTSRPLWFALAGGLILNLPTFILFYLLIGRKMVASEAILFMLTFLIMGVIFGLGFVWSQLSLGRANG